MRVRLSRKQYMCESVGGAKQVVMSSAEVVFIHTITS